MGKRDYNRITEEIRRSYDLAGEAYFNLFQDDILEHGFDQGLLLSFAESFDSPPVICDMGCGPAGQYGGFIVDRCETVHGLDISPRNLVLAQGKFPALSLRCEDMISTSFRNNELDGIISFYSLFHIPKGKTLDLFREFYRILKPGGKALIVTHRGMFRKTLTRIWGREDLSLFTNFHLEWELAVPSRKAGFHIDEIYSKESYYPFPKKRIILRLLKPETSVSRFPNIC